MKALVLVVALASSAAWAQTDSCGPGKVCRPASLQTPCIPTTSLPTCGASQKGRVQCDVTQNCYVYCNGSAWACVSSGGGAAAYTGTDPIVVTGGGSDGGTIGINFASAISSGAINRVGAVLVLDAGLNILGGGLTIRDGVRATTPSTGVWMPAGAGSPATVYGMTVDRSLAVATGYCLAGSLGSCTADILYPGGTQIEIGGTTATGLNAATVNAYLGFGSSIGPIQVATYMRSVGVATGSLPTCDASLKGAIETDTTLSCAKFCNGSAWSGCLVSSTQAVNNYWSSICFGACSSEGVNFTGGIYGLTGTVAKLAVSWGVIGTAAATNSVIVKIRDVTAAGDVCTCAAIPCDTAINTPTDCTCSGALAPGNLYVAQLTTGTDCAVNPGNIVVTASMIP